MFSINSPTEGRQRLSRAKAIAATLSRAQAKPPAKVKTLAENRRRLASLLAGDTLPPSNPKKTAPTPRYL